MSHPYYHAVSSARKHGGEADSYIELHSWFDQTKALLPDFRHRALLHNAFGIFLAEQVFGPTIDVKITRCPAGGDPAGCGSTNTSMQEGDPDGMYDCHDCGLFFKPKIKKVPTRLLGEQHVQEDLGFIPHAAMYLERIAAEPWMNKSRKLSRELEAEEVAPASQP